MARITTSIPQFGTRTDLGQEEFEGFEKEEEKRDLNTREKCEAKGGFWDEKTQTCLLVKPEDIPTPTTRPGRATGSTKGPAGIPQVFTEVTTGKGGGIRLPSGEILLGLKPRDVEQILQAEAKKRQTLTAQALAGQEQQQQQKIIEEQQRLLQETGAPVRRELDPTLQTGEDFPVFGPLITKTRKLLGLSAASNSILDIIKAEGDIEKEPFFELQPEELKTLALSEIERNEIERGLTDSEKFGSFVESLSLGGLSNFAAEKPSENVQSILRQVKIVKTRATNAEIKVKDGTWRQAYGEEVIDGLEKDIQRFESRIKLLLQDSPEFKFDSDGVNFIEDKIFEARERLFSVKINMLSGASQDPSEIQVLIALQESIQSEDFEI